MALTAARKALIGPESQMISAVDAVTGHERAGAVGGGHAKDASGRARQIRIVADWHRTALA